jgi:hypothetical protein
LHLAAYYGHLSIIQELVSNYHVDINARMHNGTTALGLARDVARDFPPHLRPSIIALLELNGGIV